MSQRPEVKFLDPSDGAYGKSLVASTWGLTATEKNGVDNALGRDVLFARETVVVLTSQDAQLLARLLSILAEDAPEKPSAEQMALAKNLCTAMWQRNCTDLGTFQQF